MSEFVLRIQFNSLIAGEDVEELTNDLNIIIIFRRGFYSHRCIFINFGFVIGDIVVDDVRQTYKSFTIYYIRKEKINNLYRVVFAESRYFLFIVSGYGNIKYQKFI
jgi:hypothetical protein